jgi:hypothetical protein
MLRWVAIVFAAASRLNGASILTDVLALGHSGFGEGKDFKTRRFRNLGFRDLGFGNLGFGNLERRRPCGGEEGPAAAASRFPAPWRIVELPNGFVVNDAAGQQLGVFYGRADPNTAGHTGYVTLCEAREFAANFARLPELLKRDSNSPGAS